MGSAFHWRAMPFLQSNVSDVISGANGSKIKIRLVQHIRARQLSYGSCGPHGHCSQQVVSARINVTHSIPLPFDCFGKDLSGNRFSSTRLWTFPGLVARSKT